MIYKILIVEDEPPIIRYLQRLIDINCEGFAVMNTAENGAEALVKIGLARPDIVLTDVRMPVMDGLALVKSLKASYPEIYTVIISGFQEFEYAKEALKYGVVDYLLKPVDPVLLKKIFGELHGKLDKYYLSAGINLLERLISNLPVQKEMINNILNVRLLYAFLIRKGPIPGRLVNKYYELEGINWFSELDTHQFAGIQNIEKVWILGGRDECERLVVLGVQGADFHTVKNFRETLISMLPQSPGFYTVVHSSNPFQIEGISKEFVRMNSVLEQLATLGKNQVLEVNSLSEKKSTHSYTLNNAIESKLSLYISNGNIDRLKNEIVKLFDAWEREDCPQIYVEKMLHQIFQIVEKNVGHYTPENTLKVEKQLEEAIVCSENFSGLLIYIWDIIEDLVSKKNNGRTYERLDSINMFHTIEQYIENNLSKPIMLQGVCDLFGISQAYLSRMFRKYKDMSFNEYVNITKINEAKRIMLENPDILVKDVATIAGYNDPYYFSKIFKSVTGTSPSDFRSFPTQQPGSVANENR